MDRLVGEVGGGVVIRGGLASHPRRPSQPSGADHGAPAGVACQPTVALAGERPLGQRRCPAPLRPLTTDETRRKRGQRRPLLDGRQSGDALGGSPLSGPAGGGVSDPSSAIRLPTHRGTGGAPRYWEDACYPRAWVASVKRAIESAHQPDCRSVSVRRSAKQPRAADSLATRSVKTAQQPPCHEGGHRVVPPLRRGAQACGLAWRRAATASPIRESPARTRMMVSRRSR